MKNIQLSFNKFPKSKPRKGEVILPHLFAFIKTMITNFIKSTHFALNLGLLNFNSVIILNRLVTIENALLLQFVKT